MDLGIGEKDYEDDKMEEAEAEQEGNGSEMVSGTGTKKNDGDNGDDNGDAGAGLHVTSGPSGQISSPTPSMLAARAELERLRNTTWAHEIMYRNLRPPRR